MSEPKPVVEVTVRTDLYSEPDIEDLEMRVSELRATGHTIVGLKIEPSYEDSHTIILISRRPETLDEAAERERLRLLHAASQIDYERRQYEALKKKFEGGK